MLSQNNLVTPFAEVFFIVGTKCAIFVILLHTTKILLYLYTSSSFVIKSAKMCIQGFFGTVFGMSFLAGASVQFLFLWHASHSFIYFFTSFVTPGHQKFLVTNSVVFYCPSYPPTSILWYSQITFALNFLSFGTYTFLL